MASVKPISTIRAAFPSSDVLFSLAVVNVVVVVVVVVVGNPYIFEKSTFSTQRWF